MRISLKFLLTDNKITIEYRRNILSFIKNALNTANEKYFEQYYGKHQYKPFCWDVFMNIDKIDKNIIYLKTNEITLYFSTSDVKLGYIFTNAFLGQKNKPFKIQNEQFMILVNVNELNEKKITNECVVCKTASPICLIEQKNKDYKTNHFLCFQDDNFDKIFKEKTGLEIIPIDCKKTIVQHYNIKFPTTTGTFLLKGPTNLLNKFYLDGVGDKHNQGFGSFNIV